MNKNTSEESSKLMAKRQKELAIIFVLFVVMISAVSTTFMMASIYSDCFGIGDFFKTPLPYVGFFDAVVVIGVLFGISSISFVRFVAFSIAGFSLYCGWSAGEINFIFSDVDNLYSLFFNGYGIVGLSHIAMALLTFGFGKIFSILIGLIGLAYWVSPILLVVTNN